jgi:hypothetical protein
MDNLKPCPFCGGEPYYTDAPYTHAGVNMILCGNCGCRFYNADCKKWNTRPTEATARAETLMEAAERAIGHVQDRCYCGMTIGDANDLRAAIVEDSAVYQKALVDMSLRLSDKQEEK